MRTAQRPQPRPNLVLATSLRSARGDARSDEVRCDAEDPRASTTQAVMFDPVLALNMLTATVRWEWMFP